MKNGSATLNLLVRLFLQLLVILNCNLQCHALLYLALQFEYEKRHYLVVFHKPKPQPTRSVCLSGSRRRRNPIKPWRHTDDVIETNEGRRQVAYDCLIEFVVVN